MKRFNWLSWRLPTSRARCGRKSTEEIGQNWKPCLMKRACGTHTLRCLRKCFTMCKRNLPALFCTPLKRTSMWISRKVEYKTRANLPRGHEERSCTATRIRHRWWVQRRSRVSGHWKNSRRAWFKIYTVNILLYETLGLSMELNDDILVQTTSLHTTVPVHVRLTIYYNIKK